MFSEFSHSSDSSDSSMFSIRAMRLEDAAIVAQLERELFSSASWSEQMIEQELNAPDRFYYVCECQDERGDESADESLHESLRESLRESVGSACIVGYAGVWAGVPDSEVMTVGVATEYQRRGIGRQLLECLINAACSFGSRRLLLEVRVDNSPAIHLYEKYGFTRMGIRKHYYQPEDIDALTLELDVREWNGREGNEKNNE